MFVCVFTCLCVCVYVFVCVCSCVCVHVFVFMCVCVGCTLVVNLGIYRCHGEYSVVSLTSCRRTVVVLPQL